MTNLNNQSVDVVLSSFAAPLGRYINRLTKNSGDAEDILQETLLKIENGLNDFNDLANIRPWAYRVATNTAIDFFRKNDKAKRITDTGVCAADFPDDSADFDDPLVVDEMNDCIRSMVHELPVEYRLPTVLFRLEEKSITEIADILEVSSETVKVRIHRGKNLLEKKLANGCHFYATNSGILRCEKKQK